MKVLGIQIANGFGSEARVMADLLAFRADRYDALVVHHAWDGDRASAERFREASRSFIFPFDAGWRPNPDGKRPFLAKVLSHVKLRLALRRIVPDVRIYDPDVIVSNQQKWDCSAATFIARKLRKPQAILLCYPIGPWLGRSVVRRLRTCECVIAIDDHARNSALRHGVRPERIAKVLPPIRPPAAAPSDARERVRAELGIPLDAPLVGIVARLDPQKRQGDVIAAFARIAARFPEAHLLIVGEPASSGGTPRAVLEGLAARTGVTSRIVFEGYRGDLVRVLAALDIFIHPSLDDTISLAPLEASAAGLPIVAYAESGALEAVLHGQTGLLASPGDVDALADCLARLLASPDDARRMGLAGHEFVRASFEPRRWAEMFAHALSAAAAVPLAEPARKPVQPPYRAPGERAG